MPVVLTLFLFLFLLLVGPRDLQAMENIIRDPSGLNVEDPQYLEHRKLQDDQERGLALYRQKKFAEAYALLADPARQGMKGAQHAIAMMHIKGQSVPKNTLIGIALLGLAAESGDRRIQRDYEKSLKSVSSEHRPLVEQQVEYYKARYGMAVQGVSCTTRKRSGSHMRATQCIKSPGDYPDYAWSP